MAPSNCQTFVAILLLLLPLATKGVDNNIPPILSPFFENICNVVECGRGRCVADQGHPFNFTCDCEDGWRRTRLEDDDEQDLEFLPCVIPDCSLEYSCMPAPPPPAIGSTVDQEAAQGIQRIHTRVNAMRATLIF
ncbi:vitamin K-dependent protein C [Striga asiatica]|uniref:Vitamin K-dependent protein C n=1 Tax=Striga asiatica TaxID=4170 RepID=A0A5A7QMG5_STRAF|nr:vitamin K-dependent protein C [Striga asiatica]